MCAIALVAIRAPCNQSEAKNEDNLLLNRREDAHGLSNGSLEIKEALLEIPQVSPIPHAFR